MTSFEETVSKIPYQYKHSRLLHDLVIWLEPDICVEVGTHIGFSACWMARAIQLNNKGRLFCIDNFCWTEEAQEEQWEANLRECGVRDWVTLLKGRSEEVDWPERVDFAYIDGNHTYPVCKHDAEKARELGAKVIVLHDTVSWEGSRKYADEMRREWHDWDFLEENSDCGLLIAKKREPKGVCEGEDVGEKWDVPAGEKRKPGRPAKVKAE
jgi:predicted O-methyltransferase YrrM